jgi:hypothetical protein
MKSDTLVVNVNQYHTFPDALAAMDRLMNQFLQTVQPFSIESQQLSFINGYLIMTIFSH